MNAKKAKTVVVILLTLSAVRVARADSAPASVHQGNKLYNQENFAGAIEKYDQALLDQPQSLEPKFNKANCYFQLDDLARAIDLYNEVAAQSKDMKLVAAAKYNLGNCYFHRGTKQKDSDLQKALEDLQTSIVQWRQTLDVEPENQNAAKNIEVARLIIKDIIDQINKQKKEQEQQAQKQKQMQEKLKELLDKQKALAEKTQQTKNQAENQQIDQQQASENYNKQADEQSQLKEQTRQTSQSAGGGQQQDPNNPQPPQMQQAAGELEQAIERQTEAGEQLKNSQPNVAKNSQDQAAEHIENAIKALSGENAQNQQQQQQQQQQRQTQQQQQEPDQSEQENQQQSQQQQQAAVAPDTTEQEILDKEQRQKEQRQMLQRAPYQKVEKDW